MTALVELLNDVRAQIEADREALAEARNRLSIVKDAALTFHGALRTYSSGSLAVHTMNFPVTDGDGGVVLDRRCYQALGPEGAGELPQSVVDDLCGVIGPLIRETYPGARVNTSKRGPMVTFGAPVNGQNPTVDLVVALTRKEGDGLWIPNLKKNSWEPSDPEAHVRILNNGGSTSARSIRRKVIRLAKAWNKQFGEPGVSSFMLSVWAYEFVEAGMGVPAGLHALFEGAAKRLENHQATRDPAGVSANLKPLIETDKVRARLRKAADALAEALEHCDDEDEVRTALAKVYPKYVEEPSAKGLIAAVAALSSRKPIPAPSLGIGSAVATMINPTRSFGD